jgi:hypothetical protein
MDVDVCRHLGFRLEAHQPASAPHARKLGHDFLDIAAPGEILGRPHRPFEVVARSAARRDEPNGHIAGKAGRVRDPGRGRKICNLFPQGVGGESDGQLEEWLGEAHVRQSNRLAGARHERARNPLPARLSLL